ncbi:demethylmenaquinone methyltransferase / 2-methoxy-6-polyprenyl-1,4-benzoquinol methylase [Nocardia amikacinitolerans]|uniref:Demethylmenaquinone methyltransferase / 2-methoxy-6-polyprenyl-1,4-benzoquinol methylase n=2 Tax=Nocardia amikacinitolerans TaxID=756689 RepID=A0A285LR95_9NOCA|nr:demethylmenaquinone methyltransferase / 2-methoxy-6-polyprenyl-1,4-benzoquinol methylase [Nocardia amikacinitolerans]SNY87415.1 demethylmenaquinone methyltransferase / 2-methoxy-6-polyprenyl-1,4-benzoquinol methylase [Nocardia amikacinitolerans]
MLLPLVAAATTSDHEHMSGNAQQSTNDQAAEIGLLLTRPRGYRLVRSAFLLGRGRALDAALVARSGAAPGDRVLDIGCGPGDFVRRLAVRVGPQGEVVGRDPSPRMIAYATAHTKQPNCRFELGPAQTLDQPDASFDLVTCTFVMHHIPETQRRAALAHMYRVLRPGGRLLLADTHPAGRVLPAVIRTMSRFAAHRTGDAAGQHADPLAAIDIRRYREPLSAAGFRSIEFETVAPIAGVLLATK